jgi:hypothetical protein
VCVCVCRLCLTKYNAVLNVAVEGLDHIEKQRREKIILPFLMHGYLQNYRQILAG